MHDFFLQDELWVKRLVVFWVPPHEGVAKTCHRKVVETVNMTSLVLANILDATS